MTWHNIGKQTNKKQTTTTTTTTKNNKRLGNRSWSTQAFQIPVWCPKSQDHLFSVLWLYSRAESCHLYSDRDPSVESAFDTVAQAMGWGGKAHSQKQHQIYSWWRESTLLGLTSWIVRSLLWADLSAYDSTWHVRYMLGISLYYWTITLVLC